MAGGRNDPDAMEVDGQGGDADAGGGGGGAGPSNGGVGQQEDVDSTLGSLDFSRLSHDHKAAQDATAKEALEK